MTQGTALPVGRLAPSPTGRLHLGHARTFLLAWWHLRSRGGRLWLRIEDLDRERVKPGLVDACRRDLEWLGLDWDGAPLLQSADTSAMEAALGRLLDSGAAYVCACSRQDIARALSAPHAGQGELRYPGTCRARRIPLARAGSGATAIRLRVFDGEVELVDGFAGSFRTDVQREVGDFLLARRDGAYAYQLAVVVDDERLGVTEVHRGDDLIPSTARQWHLQQALGCSSPAWFHLPLVCDADGRRLAKRSADLSLHALRSGGVDPRAVVAWVARSAGQAAGDRLRPHELLGSFDLARVPRAPVLLGPRDVAWMLRSP